MSSDDLTDEQLADLARLIDGTLPADRRAEIEAEVAASPQLTAAVASQGAAIDALRATAAVGAPSGLRRRIEAPPARAPRRFVRPVSVGLAAAAVAIAIVAVLPHNGPSVGDTARIAQKRATDPAPAGAPGTP